ncbi:MAG: Ig domain-containing protein [Actinomycetota bacterium]|nr:Ig domain-containing protein [Actinomycetota bacterium]
MIKIIIDKQGEKYVTKKLLIVLLSGLMLILCTGCVPGLFPEPENNAPNITSDPITTATVGLNYTYSVEAIDEDDDTLIYVLTTKPKEMIISFSSGIITWTPSTARTYDVVVEVSDGTLTDSQSFTLTVGAGEPQPTTTKRVVMWELFIGPVCSRCEGVSQYIAQLREEYAYDELVLLEEYGWDYQEYTGWEVKDVKARYYDYRSVTGTEYAALPAAYFNGINQFVYYGDRGYDSYKAAIEAELSKPVKVTISATYDVIGTTVNITGNVFNASDSILNNIVVEAMVYENSVYSEKWKKNVDYVVRDIITYEESGELIASFAPGKSHEFSLTSSSLSNVKDMSNIHVVVYVQAPFSPTKEILQALYVEQD